MIKRIFNRYKKLLAVILLLVAFFTAIYFIDLIKFNKNHVNYDEKYMIKMMFLIADKNTTSDEDTIAEVADYDDEVEKMLFSMNEVIPLEKKGNYLYGYLDKFTNDKLLEKVTDYVFANNNDLGEVIDGCEYDSKTKTIKIPFSYYENIGEYEVPIEAQLLSLLSVEDLMSMDVDVSIKKLITIDKTITNDNLSNETKIPLYNNFITARDLEVYVNNSDTAIDKDYLDYDKKTSMLTLYMPAILIDKIDIKINSILPSVSALSSTTVANMHAIEIEDRPNIPSGGSRYVDAVFYKPGGSLNANSVNAVTCHDWSNSNDDNMGVMCSDKKGKLPAMNIDHLSSTNNNPFRMTRYTMYYSYIPKDHSGTKDTYSKQNISSASSSTKFYKINYSVSNTYAMRLSVFDSNAAYASYTDFDNRSNSIGTLLTFKGNTFKTVKLDSNNHATHNNADYYTKTVDASDMKNYWISLHCISASSTAGMSSDLYYKLYNIYEDSNSMVVKIRIAYGSSSSSAYLKNSGISSTQGAIGYIKFTWSNTCKVQPMKKFSTGTTIPNGAKATFELHQGNGYNGTRCTGALLDTKTVVINSSNLSADGTYYTVPNGTFNSGLRIGSEYCMQETSFVDANGKDLLAHDYKRVNNVTIFTAVDSDENGTCDTWPSMENKERLYCAAIKKVDKETNIGLRNVNFTLNGSGSYATNNDGIYVWTNLKYGTYYANETTPSGTALIGTDNKTYNYFNDSSANIALTLTEEDDSYNCPSNVAITTHKDTKMYYCIKVKKTDFNTGVTLNGAEFTATKGNITIDKNSNNYRSSNGIVSFFIGDSSKAGNYVITETKAPDGYSIDTSSKTVAAIALNRYDNEAAARTACLSDNAISSDGTTTIANKTYNLSENYVFKDKKVLLNWYKTTENGINKVNGAEFKVKNSDGQYLTVSAPVSQKDENNVEKACYVYTGTNGTGTAMTSGANGSTNISMTGEVCISGLPTGTYTVIETKTPEYHTFNTTSTKDIATSNAFSNMTNSNKIVNQPTEFRFTKTVTNTDGSQEDNTKYTVTINGVTKTVSLSEMTTEELMKIGFTIYDSNGDAVGLKEISSGYYEYGSNSIDQVGSSNNITVLHLDKNRQIYVKHLPKGTYTIKEVDTSSCALSNGGFGTSLNPTSRPNTAPSCSNGMTGNNGECIGYYSPDYGYNTYPFTIDDCSSQTSSQNSLACGTQGGVELQTLNNTPTETILTKKDLYRYMDQADIVDNNREQNSTETQAEFENAKERSDFDRIDFKVKDRNGNYLNFIYVGNSSTTCDSDNDYSIYRYVPGLQLPNGVDPDVFNYHAGSNGLTITQTLHACGGHIKLISLCRGETYTFEEVRVPDDSVYVLAKVGELNPEVCFEIPCSVDDEEQRTSTTAVINDKPTRVTFEKKDGKYNYLIPDETTTFEVYRCPKVDGNNTLCNPSSYSTVAEREAAGMKLIKFTPRGIITNDEEDPGLEVYRMMSDSDAENKSLCTDNNTSNCYVTSVHPVGGRLVLRYLQSGYNYVLLETVAPQHYMLPKGKGSETPFTVINTTVDVEQIDIPNSPTAIVIRKYADLDGDGVADSDKLLGGAKFKVYKVTNYNVNRKAKDQEKELIKLKTIKDGIYENRPVLDTDVVTTCTGENCSYTSKSLGYDISTWDTIDDLINASGDDVTTVLKEGTALLQYLDYDAYYVIEEVEAPKGYSLPEKDDDRFTLVYIRKNETEIIDTADALVNKPTSFTFYKFDEFNTPLDGATFYLQKLDNNKKYNTLTVSTEELITGETIYKADPESELTEITTVGGKATVYYLEPGQYRILEVKAPEGYELPKKTINVATFFVDEDGLVYGSNIISNKKPAEIIEYLASSKAELIINIQTGKVVIKYGLIITALIGAIVGLILLLNRKKQ